MIVEALIREVNPVNPEAVPGPESDEARVTLCHLLTTPAARRLVPQRRFTLLALGTVGAAALLLAILLPGSPVLPNPAAAATLRHLAEVAADQPATNPPGVGQYQYTGSVGTYPSCNLDGKRSYCYFLPEHRQIWIGWNDSGRILETFGTPSFITPTDRANWESFGSPSLPTGPSDTTFGPNTLSVGPSDLSSLSTDPSALASQLLAGKLERVPSGPGEEFIQIGDLLRETDASPALRAAAFQVAANIPGVELLGQVRDHIGRIGIGLAMTFGGVRNELIFDPSTSALLGEEGVAEGVQETEASVPAGTVMDWAVYLSSGIVDSLSSTPTGSAPPAPPVCVVAAPPPTSTSVPTLSGPGAGINICHSSPSRNTGTQGTSAASGP